MKNPEVPSVQQDSADSPAEESFLQRWSQRKLNNSVAKNEIEAEEQQLEESSNDPAPDQSHHELTDKDMPPLESLDENSDYSGFFSPKVSETLRRQALRKLFHSQSFNITDGLNDYDDDYTQFEKLGSVVTHEMKRLLDSETEKLAADQKTDEPVNKENQLAANTDTESAESTENTKSTENLEPLENSKHMTEDNLIES